MIDLTYQIWNEAKSCKVWGLEHEKWTITHSVFYVIDNQEICNTHELETRMVQDFFIPSNLIHMLLIFQEIAHKWPWTWVIMTRAILKPTQIDKWQINCLSQVSEMMVCQGHTLLKLEEFV